MVGSPGHGRCPALPSPQGHCWEPQGPREWLWRGGQKLLACAPAPCVSGHHPALCPPALPPAGLAAAAAPPESPAAFPVPAAAPRPAAAPPAGLGPGCPSHCKTKRRRVEEDARAAPAQPAMLCPNHKPHPLWLLPLGSLPCLPVAHLFHPHLPGTDSSQLPSPPPCPPGGPVNWMEALDYFQPSHQAKEAGLGSWETGSLAAISTSPYDQETPPTASYAPLLWEAQ